MGYLSCYCFKKIPFEPRHLPPQKNATLSDCVLLKWRDGLRAELDCASLALRVFAPQKSPSSLAIYRHKKTQPFQIAFFKVAGWTRCRRSCVSILIIRIYFRWRRVVANFLSFAPQVLRRIEVLRSYERLFIGIYFVSIYNVVRRTPYALFQKDAFCDEVVDFARGGVLRAVADIRPAR